jgi:hypothetical protein
LTSQLESSPLQTRIVTVAGVEVPLGDLQIRREVRRPVHERNEQRDVHPDAANSMLPLMKGVAGAFTSLRDAEQSRGAGVTFAIRSKLGPCSASPG